MASKKINLIGVILILWLFYLLYSYRFSVDFIIIKILSVIFLLFILTLENGFWILIIIISLSSIVNISALPQPFEIGNLGFTVPEFFSLILILYGFIKFGLNENNKFRNKIVKSPVFLLYLWVPFCMLNSLVSSNVSFLQAFFSARKYIFYILYFAPLLLWHSLKRVKKYMYVLILISFLLSVFVLIEYVIRDPLPSFLAHYTVIPINPLNFTEVVRMTPNFHSLIYLSFFWCLPLAILTRRRIFFIILIVEFAALFVFFTRNIYLSMLIGFMITVLMLRRNRFSALTYIFLFLIIGFVGVYFLTASLGVANPVDILFVRISELFSEEPLQSGTLSSRILEGSTMLERIKESPIIGKGIGTLFYNPVFQKYSPGGHSGYLDILFQMGIIGLLIFIGIFYRFIKLCIRLYGEISDVYIKAFILGSLSSFCGILVAVLVKPVFVNEPWWITNLAVIWGITELINQVQKRRRNDPGVSTIDGK